jgi:NADH-quinone oxidoreductase subunit C
VSAGAEHLSQVAAGLGDAVLGSGMAHGLLVLEVAPAGVAGLARRLRDEFGFDMFLDVTAVDWPQRRPRFDVVYHFYSTRHFVRVRVRTQVDEADPTVDTLVPLYGSAAYMERECHEMYGIRFRGNADLRPILLYEGFVGHPLRKDYPKQAEQPLVPYREERRS